VEKSEKLKEISGKLPVSFKEPDFVFLREYCQVNYVYIFCKLFLVINNSKLDV